MTCLECGKTFKILTRRHLASHGMDAAAYRETQRNIATAVKNLSQDA